MITAHPYMGRMRQIFIHENRPGPSESVEAEMTGALCGSATATQNQRGSSWMKREQKNRPEGVEERHRGCARRSTESPV